MTSCSACTARNDALIALWNTSGAIVMLAVAEDLELTSFRSVAMSSWVFLRSTRTPATPKPAMSGSKRAPPMIAAHSQSPSRVGAPAAA
jgi:hypothetical protein